MAVLCAAVLLLATHAVLAGDPGAVGDLYVAGIDSVVQFDGVTGALVGTFVAPGSGGLQQPYSPTFGPNGNLFVCDRAPSSYVNNGVLEFDGATGAFLREFVLSGTGLESGWLDNPIDLLFLADGRLLACSGDDHSVQAYDAAGALDAPGTSAEWLGTFAIGGKTPGALLFPWSIAEGPDGSLFVATSQWNDGTEGEIIEYHPTTGRLVRRFAAPGGMVYPVDIVLRPNGNLLVSYFSDGVFEFDTVTGAFLGMFTEPGHQGSYWGITLGPNGNLFVVGSGLVNEYDGASGAFVGTFASSGMPSSSASHLVFKPPPNPLSAPTITGFSVAQHDACDPLIGVTVTGTNLNPAETTVMLENPNEPLGTNGLVVTYTGVVTGDSGDGTSLTVDFDLDGGARMVGGLWDVAVTNPDGQSDTLAAAIQIAPCYVAAEGNLFVLGDRHHTATRYGLFEFDGATGDLVGFMVEDPSGVAGDDLGGSPGFLFGHDGNLLIASPSPYDLLQAPLGSVLQYDGTTGRKLSTFIPTGAGGMLLPKRLTFGPNGNLFVLHRGSIPPVSGVLEFDGLTGAFVRELVPLGACGLLRAGGLEFAPNGNLYVTERTDPAIGPNGGVYVFDGQTGECLEAPLIPSPAEPGTRFGPIEFSPHDRNLVLAWHSDTVAPGAGLGRVTVHNPETGALLTTPIPPPAGDIEQASSSDFGPNGHLFVLGHPGLVFEYDLIAEQVVGIFATQTVYGGGTAPANEILFKSLLGDADGDWDLDLSDFAAFQACFTGEGVTPANYNCLTFDHDRDGDVDLTDLSAFTDRLTGPVAHAAPPGACCLPDGGCQESTTAVECVVELGGSWLGYGSTCTDGCPAFGACCDPYDGTCTLRTEAQCDYYGGDYQGDGTDCATAGCPPPGACCFFDDGSCEELTELACLDLGGPNQGTGAYQGDYTECATTDCPYGRYSNEIDPMTSAAVAGAGLQIADDMTLEGTGARDLVYLDLRVYGNGGGDFDVTVELWTDCPGDGGTLIPDTTFTWTGVPDDGYVYTLVVDPVTPQVTIPDTVWMVATFTTPESGWIIAEQAETGATADLYGRDNPWDCNADFGGDPYAGLWANLRCVEGSSKRGSDGESRLSIQQVPTPLSIEAVGAGN